MSESGPDTEAVVGAAGGDGQDAQPGIAELSAISVLNNEWQAISIEQRGPDGTEVIGMVIFYSCPVCNAVVAPPAGEINFPQEHAKWHVKQARDWDHVNTVIAAVQQNGEESSTGWVPPPICPECRDGKHPNCTGEALDTATDQIVPCACPVGGVHPQRRD